MLKLGESSGSALAENEKYLDSVAGRAAKLQSSIEALFTTIMTGDSVKDAISVLDALVQALDAISSFSFDNLASTITTLTGLGGGIAFFKNLG